LRLKEIYRERRNEMTRGIKILISAHAVIVAWVMCGIAGFLDGRWGGIGIMLFLLTFIGLVNWATHTLNQEFYSTKGWKSPC